MTTYKVGDKVESFGSDLPVGTILRDDDGDTATKVQANPEKWGRVYVTDPENPGMVLNHQPSGTIVYLPEPAPEPAKQVGDVVRTGAELHALPNGTAVRDQGWDLWKKDYGVWYLAGVSPLYSSETMAETIDAPFVILHLPTKD